MERLQLLQILLSSFCQGHSVVYIGHKRLNSYYESNSEDVLIEIYVSSKF